jgi:malonyl-CoA/methylmalonyl-CoA synthetase
MMDDNLYTMLLARRDDAAVALRTHDEIVSYGELRRRAARMAHRLVALGVQPGDRVAVQVEKSATALIVYLAALAAGAVYLPLNTGYTATELGYFLADAEPRLVIVDPSAATTTAPLAATIDAVLCTLAADGGSGTLLEGGDALSDAFDAVPRGRDDLAAILYTSGTTGRSKGAMLSHGNLASNAETLVDAWRFTAADALLHALPIYHTHGLFVATNVALLSGASINLLPRFDADAVFAWLPRSTVMMGVPTFYTRLLADPRLTRVVAAPLRLFVSGSAPLLAETHEAWSERTGHAILERYGMTETGMNTSNPYDGERRPGTVGPPLPGVAVRIVDDARRSLAAGDVGMIEVRGPNVFHGYWRMPDKTAEDLKADGWFVTGDLGRRSADGYVEIVGRGKDLIITGGLNVYPKEVETLIDAVPGVVESAVVGLPHPDFGEAVTAIVVCDAHDAAVPDTIRADLPRQLAAFKCPKRIVVVDELPRNGMGKVQKAALREQYKDLYAA